MWLETHCGARFRDDQPVNYEFEGPFLWGCDRPRGHNGPHDYEDGGMYATRVLGPKLDRLLGYLEFLTQAPRPSGILLEDEK